MSNLGHPCERKLWLSIREGEKAIPLRAETHMKFLYGDLIEELVLFLAEIAGHKVEGRQTRLEINGVYGSRDAIIDGVLVDVKSASSFSFEKFKSGLSPEDDGFGYIPQLQSYLFASQNDPLLVDKERAAFLVIDKTLGHICLDMHPKTFVDMSSFVDHKKKMLEGSLPNRKFEPVAVGASGNMGLSMVCRYCDMRKACHPGLRTFLYSNGPMQLTKVVKLPNVPEVSE